MKTNEEIIQELMVAVVQLELSELKLTASEEHTLEFLYDEVGERLHAL